VGRPVCKNKTSAISENVSFHCQYCAAAAVGRPGESGLHLFSKNVYLSVIKSKSQ